MPLYQPFAGADAADAASEARRWLEETLGDAPPPPVLAVIGLESGHLLDVLAERAPETRVLALEPDPVAAADFRARPMAGGWLSGGRLVHLVDPEYAGSDRAWRMLDGAPVPTVLTHPRLAIHAEPSVRAARTLKNIVFGARANAAARRKFAPRYLLNALRNVPSMLRGRDVQALAGACRGVPAVITAAGPSLDTAIEDLRSVSGRALLIATDTSLRPLLHAGIVPPLVVALDPGAANARHFQSLPDCPETWLVSELAVDRHATAVFGERVFWFRAADHQPWPLLAELGIEAARLDVWGSVLTGAFQVACLAGCDPIVFAGADLAYTGGRPYARGTTYEFDWAWHTGQGMSLQDVWREQIERRELQQETDLRGKPTVTTTSLLSFRDWLLARARDGRTRIVNATGAGMLFGEGIDQLALSDALRSTVEGVTWSPGGHPRRPLRPSAVAARLRRLGSAVRAGDRSAPIDAWAAFSGEGFDPPAVATALEDAAHAIETKRTSPPRARLVDWCRIHAGASSHSLPRALPEAVARFRDLLQAGMTEQAGTSSDVADDGHAALLHALGLLSAVRREAFRLDDMFPASDPAHAAVAPVSVLFHWPDHLRWAIQLVEAVLGTGVGSMRAISGRTLSAAAPADRPVTGDAGAPDPRPNTSFAIVTLALQWLRCADAVAASEPLSLALEDLLEAAPRLPTRSTGAGTDTLLIRGGSDVLEVPLGRSTKSAAPAGNPLGRSTELARFTLCGTQVTLTVVEGTRPDRPAVPRLPGAAS